MQNRPLPQYLPKVRDNTMFKCHAILAAFILCLVSSPSSISRESSAVVTVAQQLLNPITADRILLIGFSDRHIDRIQRSSSSNSYRKRGSYNSSSWAQFITSELEEKYGLRKLTEWPMSEAGIHCAVYWVPEPLSVGDTIESLTRERHIEIVQQMHNFKTQGHRYNDPYYRLQSNMHQMDIEQAHARATGKNITIAVIDTGVDVTHPELSGQFASSENFVSEIFSGFSEDIHGTAVTGIIAARQNNQTGIIGVAPDAKIIALKACWPSQDHAMEAICNSFTLALAVNTAIKLGANILNLSLTGPEDPLLAVLLNKAREKGIIVVAADPGATESGQRFPASLQGVIPVRSMSNFIDNKKTDDKVIDAPGEHILTTLPYGTYDFISGSSVAAAHISGVVALMLEIYPELNEEQIRQLLKKSITVQRVNANTPSMAGLNAGKLIHALCQEHGCSGQD